jgi:DNA-binding transcriptional ArsR family regulator
MWRVHFTAEDLLQTRFAAAPAPLLELALALAALQRRDGGALFAAWRGRLRQSLPRIVAPMLGLLPPSGTGPCFLGPISSDFADGLDRVLSTPSEQARTELQRVCIADRSLVPWTRQLATRDGDTWRMLGQALLAAYRTALEPQWEAVSAGHHADLAFRGHILAEQGLRAALASVYRSARWNGTVLEIPALSDRDLHLGGRGATLIPSAFWIAHPLDSEAPDEPTVFTYPALTPMLMLAAQPDGDPLAELLGRTRAAVLRSLVVDRSTTELATGVSISVSAASEHAKTLRRNGLITTLRDGKAVIHRCTHLGLRLVAAPPTANGSSNVALALGTSHRPERLRR